MKNNNVKKIAGRTKLFSAIGMFTVSAVMLASSTYAWFTMNKTVEVTGMQLKAQAEKGILINEKTGKTSNDGTWSESALAASTVHALRPASSANLTAWWHANSKKTNTEAGIKVVDDVVSVDTDTVTISGSNYYANIAYTDENGSVKKNTTAAVADESAEMTVFYTDGTGEKTGYDNGEGYYVQYKYYLKSSSNEAMTVKSGDLQAKVTATLQNTPTATAQDLDKAIRVGVKVSDDSKATIFAPVANSTSSPYKVAGSAAGATFQDVTPVGANTATAINAAAVTLPAVNADAGLEVDVFVWFEGEDVNCKSDNIAATLNAYQIDVTFIDAALGTDT